MRSYLRWVPFLALLLAADPACVTSPEAALDGAPSATPHFRVETERRGLEVMLSEDGLQAHGVETVALGEVKKLPERRAEELLSRLPPLIEDGLGLDFAMRSASMPPPLTGDIVRVEAPSRPPEIAPPEAESGALRVLRKAPEGSVEIAPHVSVTFSQPMVAITSQEQASRTIPARLEPEVPGRWRWLGTRTLLFDPEPRLPMATNYTVEIPAGTVSALGNRLEKATRFSFATPPLRVRTAHPYGGPQGLEPFILLGFDQAVNAEALLPFIRLRGAGGTVNLRLASAEEIAADRDAAAWVGTQVEGRYLALRPTEPLKTSSAYTISVEAQAPSAEGPRKTEKAWAQSFYTYHPLRVTQQDCSRSLKGCDPRGSLWIYFNNSLDAEAFDPDSVEVRPPVEGLRAVAQGPYLTLYGRFKPMSDVKIVLPAGLRDGFGQTLGSRQERTFALGRSPRSIEGPGRDFLVLDPTASPAYSVYTVNHESVKLRVWGVAPEDFSRVSEWMRKALYDGDYSKNPPGRPLANRVVRVDGYVPDEMVETAIDLSPYLKEGTGHLLVLVEPTIQPRDRWERIYLVSWVQATRVGLTAFADGEKVLGWATSLADGRPLEGVELQLLGRSEKVPSAADGLGRLAPYPDGRGPQALLGRVGADVAILPERLGWWNEGGGWSVGDFQQGLSWYVFDDRRMYRPGEEVRVKGWLRRLDNTPGGDLQPFGRAATGLNFTLRDALGNEIGKGNALVDDNGGFDLALRLPDTPNLGWANLTLIAEGCALHQAAWSHQFQIQEFRRPEFEVVSSLDSRPYVLGESAHASVTASYFAGGALPAAPTTWLVSWEPASFVPPGRADFQFGSWDPWWSPRSEDPAENLRGSAVLSGQTDPSGTHRLRMDFVALNPPRPMSVRAEASVSDVNRQTWTSAQSLVLHPSSRYVGLRPKRWFFDADSPVEVEALVVDLDGGAVSGIPVGLSMRRLEWSWQKGRVVQKKGEPRDCAIVSAADVRTCAFERVEGGQYEVTARVEDPEGRPSETMIHLYVSGGGPEAPSRDVAMEALTLVPDRETWQPGDTAEIYVQAPFFPAEGVATLARMGIVETLRFTLEGPSTVLRIPVTERFVPGMQLEVDVVGSATRSDDQGRPLPDKARRVAFAHGSLYLSVPPLTRTLEVVAKARAEAIQPGEATMVDILVRDAQGRPVEAELAVVAADESVLALSGYRLPDPLEVFYATRSSGLREEHLRASVTLANPLDAASGVALDGIGSLGGGEVGYGSGGGGLGTRMTTRDSIAMADAPAVTLAVTGTTSARPIGSPAEEEIAERKSRSPNKSARGSGLKAMSLEADNDDRSEAGPAIQLRTDFSALALFAPRVRTDASGRASVPLKVPDSLTRYRIMVVAVDAGRSFGKTEATLTVRKPLMVRPSPPRFLNFGDRVELPLVVQNQGDQPLDVSVALRVANARVLGRVKDELTLDGPTVAGHRLRVPAHDRREVRFPVAAALAGTARFQAVVASGTWSDAALFELPVWTPATSEAFATYGEIDRGAVSMPVDAPEDAWPQFGGLEITTSSTALSALTDAVLYLASYPFDCTEQIASKILAVAALEDVLGAFEAGGLPPPDELRDAVQKELARIDRRQHANGGFSYWPRMPDSPYVSIYTAHALVLARKKGFEVPRHVIDRSLVYLRSIERHIPSWYGPEARWSLIAYALAVRHLEGDDDLGRAKRLLQDAGLQRLPLAAQARILPILEKGGATTEALSILRNLENKATETASTAQFDVSVTDEARYVLLHSDRGTDAVALDALMEVRPHHDLVVKLVRGLLDHRRAGRWSTTQENSFVLLALDRYFRTYEAETPDFVARAWLGSSYAGDHTFKGRTTERARIDVPMRQLAKLHGSTSLVLSKEGSGRMYYRAGLRHAPRSLMLEPADYGFAVERAYEPVDHPEDVRRQKDGSIWIKAGSRVRVRLTMVAPARRYHVALVDPLPAGLEPMNPELAVTGTVPEDPNAPSDPYWWWSSAWYEHQNLRDERVEAFTSLLWEGVHTYSYVATATTPGRFVVPPTKAEEMYHPETFGRGGTDVVWVE